MSARGLKIGTILATACLAVALTACSTTGQGAADGATPTSAAPTTTVPAPKVTTSVADGATGVALTNPVGVTVEHGTLKSVKFTVASGPKFAPAPGDGMFNKARTAWLAGGDLAPSTTYRIAATVRSEDGHDAKHTTNFTTGTVAHRVAHVPERR